MNSDEQAFYDKLAKKLSYGKWELLRTEGDYMFIKAKDIKDVFKVNAAKIAEESWEDVVDVIEGRREPIVLKRMSRVVGYFSMIENWNKSKIGELKDRQAGNYKIGDDTNGD